MITWAARILLSLFLIGAALMVLLIGFWIWAMTGMVHGTEFSPDGFQLRTFSYTKPVLASKGFWIRQMRDDDFSSQLLLLKLCPVRAPQTWHLAKDNVTSIRSVDRHAEMLTNILSAKSENDQWIWIEWSKNHTGQAKRLWPLVQSLAFDRLYVITPLVFRAAKEHQTAPAAEFEAELRQLIVDELQLMVQEYLALNQPDQVSRMQTLIAKYDPDQGILPTPEELNPLPAEDEDWDSQDLLDVKDGNGETVGNRVDRDR